jgi:hypothetical protein
MSKTLHELLVKLNISNETIIDVFYLFALEKPKPILTTP